MTAIATYAQNLMDTLMRYTARAKVTGRWKLCVAGAVGFLLAGVSVTGRAMPLAMGFLCAVAPGLSTVAIALGGCLGYLLFFGEMQGLVWMAGGALAVMLVADRPIAQQQKLFLSAVTALVVSGCGVVWLLLFRDDTPVPVYLLRVLVSAGSAGLFRSFRRERRGVAGWLVSAIATMALGQLMPGFGYLAAAFLGVRGPFPMAAMAGLGLDLARVTPVPMTGVLCLSFCLRLIPGRRWLSRVAPALVYALMSAVWGGPELIPGVMLLTGGVLGDWLPGNLLSGEVLRRKGALGLAQVRLEKASLALRQMEQALLQSTSPPLDAKALLRQAAEDACDTCPERKNCKARQAVPNLPLWILEQPGLSAGDVPQGCRKTGRLLRELRRGQEQLRRLKGERSRLQEQRIALREQYGFLSGYLRSLCDGLDATQTQHPRYAAQVGACSDSREQIGGDQWQSICGCGTTEYLVLCDGMGTGEGARQDSLQTIAQLRLFLEAGLEPEAALRSLNSLCALTDRGGAATVDLLQMDLATGKSALYKWGASPSYLMKEGQLQKIGTAGPPPGVSQQARAWMERLSLGEGETLIMLSDGVGPETLDREEWTAPDLPPGELAAWILEQGPRRGDDASVVVVQLVPLGLSTQ